MRVIIKSPDGPITTVIPEPSVVVLQEFFTPRVRIISGTQHAITVLIAGTKPGLIASAWTPTEVTLIHQLTVLEVTEKKFKLPSAPVSNFYMQHINGGLPVVIGRDFKVEAEYVSWNSMGLDGLMNAGEELFVKYFI